MSPCPATAAESRLLRHLGWVVALKLLVLLALWQVLVADQRVAVDEAAVAAHQLGAPAAANHGPGDGQAAGATTPLDGERP
jgi:hypothetical protein